MLLNVLVQFHTSLTYEQIKETIEEKITEVPNTECTTMLLKTENELHTVKVESNSIQGIYIAGNRVGRLLRLVYKNPTCKKIQK